MLKMRKKNIMIAQLALVLLNMVSVMQVLVQQPMLSQVSVLNQVVGIVFIVKSYSALLTQAKDVYIEQSRLDRYRIDELEKKTSELSGKIEAIKSYNAAPYAWEKKNK